jgi:hypothetical protein
MKPGIQRFSGGSQFIKNRLENADLIEQSIKRIELITGRLWALPSLAPFPRIRSARPPVRTRAGESLLAV